MCWVSHSSGTRDRIDRFLRERGPYRISTRKGMAGLTEPDTEPDSD